MKYARCLKTLSLLILIFLFSFDVIAQNAGRVLQPGLYRCGGTVELSEISPSSMRLRGWQTQTPKPPDDRGLYFHAGFAELLSDGVTWRATAFDVAGYCCGNNVESEFRILSPTSFQVIHWRSWPLTAASPGPSEGWQSGGPCTLVGELPPAPKPKSSWPDPLPTPAPPPPDKPDLVDSGTRFSSMTGEVEVYHQGESRKDADFAKLDTVLYVGDHIITGEESSVILGFGDLTTYLVKEESEVVITTPAKVSKIGLVTGKIWVNIKKMWNEGTMEVEMSDAIAGARGTRFILEQMPGSSTTKVIEGSVIVTSKRVRQSVIVKAGYMVKATARGLGPIQAFAVSPEAANWR